MEAGADLRITDNVSLSLDYRGSFRDNESLHGLTSGLLVDF
jgi:uncharacterized protein with beta-barrel porin domain